MKVLVTGSTGQLGKSILKICNQFPELEIIPITRGELDLSELDSIASVLNKYAPEAIINTAAYTAVDKAEEEVELADTINHKAVKVIGEWCLDNNVKLIHISTDYVFDGNNKQPYTETDTPNPINIYGKSKCLGEQALLALDIHNLAIVRTSWVWSEFGNNFVKTMLRLSSERNEINVVNDQFGSPTYAGDLAHALLLLVSKLSNKTSNTYHYCNAGVCSWFEFAKEIIAQSNNTCQVNPIPSNQYKTAAKRAEYTALCNTFIKEQLSLEIPKWQISLQLGLKQITKF